MGCDIHMVLEKKVDGKWLGLHNFPYWYQRSKNGHHTAWPLACERNYDRFAALAGVRGDGPEARGVPSDASELTKEMVADWDSDGHSHSWLTLEEAMPIFMKTEWRGDSPPDSWAEKYPGCYFFGVDPDKKTEHRIVFFFDN